MALANGAADTVCGSHAGLVSGVGGRRGGAHKGGACASREGGSTVAAGSSIKGGAVSIGQALGGDVGHEEGDGEGDERLDGHCNC